MQKVGVTGGIGSGKTMVCELFRLHGIPVFNADTEAKRLSDTSPIIREKLTQLFGDDLYQNNLLSRQKLASLIFSHPENLQKVNAIIHPEVTKCFQQWAEEQRSAPFVVIEAAILFEAKFDKYVDKVITVCSPLAVRVERVAKRDKVDAAQIEARINNQMSDEEKIKRSDFVVFNDNRQSLIEQVQVFMFRFVG